MPSEFDLIRRCFSRPPRHADLGVGDDAALMRVGAGMQLVVSSDMLVEGTHFLPGCDPWSLGWKALAVNVSDLAAMAAQPRWSTLAISLPSANAGWLDEFSAGFFACCDAFGVDLVGGDTTRGPLNLCPTIFGEVPLGQAVTRAGAVPGDELWITGQPGRAALGLAHLEGRLVLAPQAAGEFLDALHRPQPRLAFGLALRELASAMLDVSDGLLGDLAHLLQRSGVGAEIDRRALPLAALLAAGVDETPALEALLRGGDDYELLFCAPRAKRPQVLACAERTGVAVHAIGRTTAHADRLEMLEIDGSLHRLCAGGYDHFTRTTGQRDA